MAPELTKIVSHVHPNHPLNYYSDPHVYTCQGCKTSGIGNRFRCHICSVDVHIYCLDCPPQLASFLHTHSLALLPCMDHRSCDVCRERIEGLFYRCDSCDFDVHPLCTQLPEQLHHGIDKRHKLRLHKLSSGRCSVCESDCSYLWVYSCNVCRVNIHPQCILKPYGPRRSENPAVPPSDSRSIPYAHEPSGFGGYGYAGGGGGHSSHWRFPNSVQFPHNNPDHSSHGRFPNFHSSYPTQPNSYGSVQFPHNNPDHSSRGRFPNFHSSYPTQPNSYGSVQFSPNNPGHSSHGRFPNFHSSYLTQPNSYGSVQFPQNNPCPRPIYGGQTSSLSSSLWGSMFGVTMISSLVENLTVGAVTDFIFGSNS
ncbi:uncharacterized protein LOC111438174 isoform X1 [Cucurbita moschata]|uniref:Uncharacterized protein LOC111438174 isoform X1 n=1 Tax=Cucurbita moschata TaxID=3662 RepID=A0A6J1EUW5_CUCMO|nr:uncharacterized protein LOC111438174 isoform X1 [Cucurbita moschata]